MADESDPIKSAATTVSVVVDVMKAAGNVPEVQQSAKNLGQAAVTLTRAINNALLPLAAVNYAVEKARLYFEQRFQSDLQGKAAHIPEEKIIEPRASIAGPALQGLAFAHEEPCLRDMYLNLLATAMDGRSSEDAHPAFVEIIKQMTSGEAELLRWLLGSAAAKPIVQIISKNTGDKGHRVVLRHLLNLREKDSPSVAVEVRMPAMIDNLMRLGLIDVRYDAWIADSSEYAWVKQRPEFKQLQARFDTEKAAVEFGKGVLERTDLGRQFAMSVGVATR